MTNEELKRTMAGLEALRKEHAASPEKARAFLVKAGIFTKSGKLTKPYRQMVPAEKRA